jgi:phage-related protein
MADGGAAAADAAASAAPAAAASSSSSTTTPAAAAAATAATATTATTATTTPAAADTPLTMGEYKKQQALVKSLITRRQELEKQLSNLEETIAHKEQVYLDATPNGNIITGYDHYMKSSGGAAAQRRKTGLGEQNKVFSRSSVSFRSGGNVREHHRTTFSRWMYRG